MEGVKKVEGNGDIRQVQRNVHGLAHTRDAEVQRPEVNERPDSAKIQQPRELERQAEFLQETLERLKKIFRGQAEFRVDRDANLIVIRIKDPETGEIIRQIPPEQALKLAKNIQELIGLLMDERV